MSSLRMSRGDTFRIDIVVSDKNGVINLTGKSLIATFKNKVTDADNVAVVQKKTSTGGIVITSAVAGEATITLLPGDTSTLPAVWTQLQWDIQLVDGASVYTVASGRLEVSPDVTISIT